MATKPIAIQCASLQIDETTGAVLVQLDAAAAIHIGEVALNDSGGVIINPAKEDSNLASVKTNTDRLSVLAWKRVTLGATATLAALLGEALNANLKRLTILPEEGSAAIYANKGGAATATTGQCPPGGWSFDATKTQADTWQFFSAAAGTAVVVQEG